MILGGELGDVVFLSQLAGGLESAPPTAERTSEMLLLAEAFARACEFSLSGRYYRLVLASPSGPGEPGPMALPGVDSALSRRARLGLAQLYRRQGLTFEAEQVLRTGLLSEEEPGPLLRQLFELALSGGTAELENARVWLAQYLALGRVLPTEAAMLQARWLAAAGELRQAEDLLRQLLRQMSADVDRPSSGEGAPALRQVSLLLAETLLKNGELVAAEKECLAIAGAAADPEVLVLLQEIYLQAGEPQAADGILQGLLQLIKDETKLLQLAELLQQRGLSAAQMKVAGQVWSARPDSLRAGFLKAEALVKAGRNTEAVQVGADLTVSFPDSAAVAALNARIYYQAGQYREAIRLCQLVLATEPERFDLQFLWVCCEMAQGNKAGATHLVQDLYPLAGSRLLAQRLTDAGLPLPLAPERTLWQILTFNRPPFDLAQEMLKAGRFFDQSLAARSKMNELVSAMVAWLRWEKSFRAALVGGR